ncbi:protein XRI1 isoform X1 [Cucumis melo var. makuwa]|uniref:Protein XRI1 isoform X1 n=1 Tax=Cucumis melo var. makuwa TaxID=1194695 RepID=A0A5A7SGS7_CUCMM|nr:protein XRI1 isoform X1 [Cucumis melo var. makuwa]TYK06471.1 protein XRI1 isoform X1 [Cucumis melo var. makuwa]
MAVVLEGRVSGALCSDAWNWEGDGYTIQKDTDIEISECLWDGVSENGDLSYVFDETTPVKACGDLAYHVTCSDDRNKKSEESRETHSQAKRRRMLQFTAQDLETSLCREDLSSRFLKSHNKDVSSLAALAEVSYGIPECSGLADNVLISCHENLDHSPEGWIAECLNDADMHCSPEDLGFAGTSDIQIDVSEFCDGAPEFKSNVVHHHPTRAPPNIIFKGRKSYIRTPTKLASSVAYPFAFIKPCGFHGDVTLKDINQRIRTPPPSKLKHQPEDPSQSYPTSAFSGKPVVGKTKIHTEGGKGSITIMRTRG